METDEEHLKRIRKRAARKLQKETGDKYTTCLRAVLAAEGGELPLEVKPAAVEENG